MEMVDNRETWKKILGGFETLGSFLGYGTIGQAIGAARQKFEGVQQQAPDKDKLAADPFGFGLDDETLFWGAVALGQNKGILNQQELNHLAQILGILKKNPGECKKFYQMIGRRESDVTIRIPDGQGGYHDAKTVGNIRGAMILKLFCSMDPKEAVKILRDSKTLSGPKDDLKYVIRLVKSVKLQKEIFKLFGVNSVEELKSQLDGWQRDHERQGREWLTERTANDKPGRMLWYLLAVLAIVGMVAFMLMTNNDIRTF